MHFKPFATWELHDGTNSDDSVKTEVLHSPGGSTLDPERGVDELIAAARASVAAGSSLGSAKGAAGGAALGRRRRRRGHRRRRGAQHAAAAGLKLDLKLLDGGSAVELSGDVVVTTDGMAVTSVGDGLHTGDGLHAGAASDDWFAAYSASGAGVRARLRRRRDDDARGARPCRRRRTAAAGEGEGAVGAQRVEDVPGLSPLLTPSTRSAPPSWTRTDRGAAYVRALSVCGGDGREVARARVQHSLWFGMVACKGRVVGRG